MSAKLQVQHDNDALDWPRPGPWATLRVQSWASQPSTPTMNDSQYSEWATHTTLLEVSAVGFPAKLSHMLFSLRVSFTQQWTA